MSNRHFKTQFKLGNLRIKTGYEVIVKNELGAGLINARVVGGVENQMTRKVDRIAVTRNQEDNDWDKIVIVLGETIHKVISDDRKREWKRVERGLFMKQETNNVRRFYVRTTRNSNRNNTDNDVDDVVLVDIKQPNDN